MRLLRALEGIWKIIELRIRLWRDERNKERIAELERLLRQWKLTGVSDDKDLLGETEKALEGKI